MATDGHHGGGGAIDVAAETELMGREHSHAQEVPSKKKKVFHPLKSLKKFFCKKKKDDRKAKSQDTLDTIQDGDGVTLSNKMSMSADSVFEKRGQKRSEGFKGSHDAIPRGGGYANELAGKLKHGRHGDDEGLPSSPTSHTTTVDVLMEGGMKDTSQSMDSDHSLMSVDSFDVELEDDFFQKEWTSAVPSKRDTSPRGRPLTNADLDLVASTSSLNISAEKHKIAVRPKRHPQQQHNHGQRRRNTSPVNTKSTSSLVVLPKVHEERPSPAAKPTKSYKALEEKLKDREAESSHPVLSEEEEQEEEEQEEPGSLSFEAESDSEEASLPKETPHVSSKKKDEEEEKASDVKVNRGSASSTRDSGYLTEAKPEAKTEAQVLTLKHVALAEEESTEDVKAQENKLKRNSSTKIVVIESDSVKLKSKADEVKVHVKDSPSRDIFRKKDPQKHVEIVESSKPDEVVGKRNSGSSDILRREKAGFRLDPGKRQTLGGSPVSTSENTVFGERKLKRSSFHEGENKWDDLGKPKEKEKPVEVEESQPQNSEFAAVFSKFKRQASSKKVQLEKEATSLVSGSSLKKKSEEKENIKNTPTVKFSPTTTEISPPSSRPSSRPVSLETVDKKDAPDRTKKHVKADDRSMTNSSQVTKSLSVRDSNRPGSNENETEKKRLVLEKSVVIETSSVTKGKSVQKPEVFESKEAGESAKVIAEEDSKVESSKPTSKPLEVLIEKQVTLEKSKSNVGVSGKESPYKRDSPQLKNRVRSQTLPEHLSVSKPLPDRKVFGASITSTKESGLNNNSTKTPTANHAKPSPLSSKPIVSDTAAPSGGTKQVPAKTEIPSVTKEETLSKSDAPSIDAPSKKPDAAPEKTVLKSSGSERAAPAKFVKHHAGDGGKPDWINLAHRKTAKKDWEDENGKKPSSNEISEGQTSAPPRSTVFDMIKSYQKLNV